MNEDKPFLKNFLAELCRGTGELIMSRYRETELAVERKADNSAVTEADRAAEHFLREVISAQFPEHGILGEEFGEVNAGAEYQWVLDPIDGTTSFISGCPLFGTLIGLMRRGKPWLGAISHPAQDLVLIGDGKTTTCNGRKVKHRKCAELEDALLLATDMRAILRPDFGALAQKVEHVRTWGDCFGYSQVAAGFADIMIDPIMNPWDLLPLVPVMEGAGVTITDLAGEPITMESDSSVAANPKLHEQVIGILRENG